MTMFHQNGLCRMGILVIVIVTISKSFQIIICHRSNSILKLFLVVYLCPFNVFVYLYIVILLTPFQCFFSFIYLYIVVNFFSKSNLAFFLPNKKCEKY